MPHLTARLFLSTLSLRRATFRSSCKGISYFLFLSTLSLRRATYQGQAGFAGYLHFYPRSPCGERPAIDVFLAVWAVISIHALLAESDAVRVWAWRTYTFLSTLSLRRATHTPRSAGPWQGISIHALLAESDSKTLSRQPRSRNFYPRSPCGERQHNHGRHRFFCKFLSTLSLRRATASVLPTIPAPAISIHALLAESDHCSQ